MKWDVFISHAFEDKEYARELADSLSKKGLKVWFDEFELHVGDSLSRSIDHGLSESAYGIVVLSQNFFAKEWTQKELGALNSRETKDKKVVLPIWLNISAQEVSRYSPMLADRFALNSVAGINKIVELLFLEIKGESLKIGGTEKKARSYLEVDLELLKKIAINKQMEVEAILVQSTELSRTDSMTFLLNRRMLIMKVQDEVLISKRAHTPLSILKLSLDNFEDINNNYDNTTADEILRSLAGELRGFIAHPNIIGRYFGEEFLIIMPNSTLVDASNQAELLCEYIRSLSMTVRDHVFCVTISVGVAQYKTNKENWDNFLDRTDKLLRQARNKGGDQWAKE